jgi:hypothetical protein
MKRMRVKFKKKIKQQKLWLNDEIESKKKNFNKKAKKKKLKI